jgi:hypothetical protein
VIDINNVLVVYFAGGMKTDWTARVKEAVPGVIYIDPRDSGLKDEKAYTAYDLAGVERADVVFGHMETTNPGGAGLAVEFAWGARAGKALLFSEQDGYPQERYFGMVRSLAHVHHKGHDSLELAIADLQRIQERGLDAFLSGLPLESEQCF